MSTADLQRLFRERLDLRIAPEMAAYVLKKINDAAEGAVAPAPIIGVNARTGVPLRVMVNLDSLHASAASLPVA